MIQDLEGHTRCSKRLPGDSNIGRGFKYTFCNTTEKLLREAPGLISSFLKLGCSKICNWLAPVYRKLACP